LGIQFGAGGATAAAELAAEGTRDAQWVISRARACLSAGAALIMIESEGITENVTRWRTEVVAEIVEALGIEQVMFEAADPAVFEQPDCAARSFALGYLGDEKYLGQNHDLPRIAQILH